MRPGHIIVFYLFILFLPSQLGKHFWPSFSLVLGIPVDYLAPTLYFTDILFFLVLFLWIIENQLNFKQIFSQIDKKFFFLSWLFLISLLISGFNALNIGVYLYSLLKILEMIILIVYIIFNIKTVKQVQNIVVFMLLGGLAEILLSGGQFYFQHSLGFWLLGERFFNLQTPQIAKVIFSDGRELLRPYGTFPHPNVLAGFLLILLSFSLWLIDSLKIFRIKIVIGLTIFFICAALLLTFSRSGWVIGFLSLIISLIYYQSKKNLDLKLIFPVLLTSLVMIFIFSFNNMIVSRFESLGDTDSLSLERRVQLMRSAFEMIKISPLTGIGLGNFIPLLPGFFNSTEAFRWIQPVHNIFILITAEIGLLGLIVFLLFIFYIYFHLWQRWRSKDQFAPFLFLALSSILLFSFVDHYFWTLQQGQLLFSLVLGLSLTKSLSFNKTGMN